MHACLPVYVCVCVCVRACACARAIVCARTKCAFWSFGHIFMCFLLCLRRKAMAVVGVTLKGEKAFRTTLLNQLYEECKAITSRDLTALRVIASITIKAANVHHLLTM